MTAVFFGLVLLVQLVLVGLFLRAQRADGSGVHPVSEESLARVKRELTDFVQSEMERLRDSDLKQAALAREELANHFTRLFSQVSQTLTQHFGAQNGQQQSLFEAFSGQLKVLTEMNESKLERVRGVVEERLATLQEDNNKKLEQMRQTVDEKLHATLEQRLSESFKQVSERLVAVHEGLGEMKTLAHDVGDLKKVLSNVKTRGTFGEVQLEMLLEQILAAEQYEKNVGTKAGSDNRVEFAIRLPGQGDGKDSIYLPIDCKFPIEDYQKMLDAEESGDLAGFGEAAKALTARIKAEAKAISSKYIDPPQTTDFAIMYLPIEGLFAEVLRVPGLAESLQRDYRVIVSGPTTLTALLNSLQMGFRTLAIQKRSSEVWELLGAIKTQFGTFGDLLDKTQKKLREASNSIDTAAKKSRTIERKLRNVQELPAVDAELLLPALASGEEDEVDDKDLASDL
ncbi:MAG: DNA recombination protein RmuC [Alicyclobacillaceae bacterium]|uniref:DNA recombination protein RmuC n=1 Tax=Alicyclobacillus sp. SP_1 TaxID=2942475 RepID=UPI0021574F44|nr:DNA recombination protein RmuC [Alicyclobacillus sp. SP_1]MCY0888292.1 DNA recombination protein RmuC [Alicyclobacillaceae bacterium]